MQAKTETHGFMQLLIREAFGQGSIENSELMSCSFPRGQCSQRRWYLWLYPLELLFAGKLSRKAEGFGD